MNLQAGSPDSLLTQKVTLQVKPYPQGHFYSCQGFKEPLAFSYIIPPIPPPAGIAGVSSLMLATTDSVVSSVLATLVAF